MKIASQPKISPDILQNATKKEPTIESQERDQQKIECISHLIPKRQKRKKKIGVRRRVKGAICMQHKYFVEASIIDINSISEGGEVSQK